MTNRTVQFLGQGYSNPPAGLAFTPCTITATVNGNVVFSGDIPTLEGSDIQYSPSAQQVLFTFEIPLETSGNLPVSLAITGDDVFLEQILANYTQIPNPIFTPEQYAVIANPSSTQTEKLVIWEPLAQPALTPSEVTVLSSTNPADAQAQYDILFAHGIEISVSSGPNGYGPIFLGAPTTPIRSNVVCTNAAFCTPNPPEPQPAEASGTWGYEVEPYPGQTATFSFDLAVSPGKE